jgi:5'-methylthioadenosine phosphorylase
LAIIGGSGFYEMPGLSGAEDHTIDTPYGAPSSPIRVGTLEGRRVAFLARHGRQHTISPSELPQRANFYALKTLGVRAVLGVSAVGSLQAQYEPGHFVVPDQLVDRTRDLRPSSFFTGGIVAHIGMADPLSPSLRSVAVAAARECGATVHDGAVNVTIEGPAFGTRAESHLYRSWGIGTVGMTALPEAKLAREAEMRYALLTAVTDYDCWHETAGDVDALEVLRVLAENVAMSRRIVQVFVRNLRLDDVAPEERALDAAIATRLSAVPPEVIERLGPILARRLSAEAP